MNVSFTACGICVCWLGATAEIRGCNRTRLLQSVLLRALHSLVCRVWCCCEENEGGVKDRLKDLGCAALPAGVPGGSHEGSDRGWRQHPRLFRLVDS